MKKAGLLRKTICLLLFISVHGLAQADTPLEIRTSSTFIRLVDDKGKVVGGFSLSRPVTVKTIKVYKR